MSKKIFKFSMGISLAIVVIASIWFLHKRYMAVEMSHMMAMDATRNTIILINTLEYLYTDDLPAVERSLRDALGIEMATLHAISPNNNIPTNVLKVIKERENFASHFDIDINDHLKYKTIVERLDRSYKTNH